MGKKAIVIPMEGRVDWDNYFLDIATLVARRSTCIRRMYGAVIVDDRHRVISTGYNGSPFGDDHCTDVGCWREEHGIPHGEQYEKCVAVHAEQNALISANGKDIVGATIYLAGYDCNKDQWIEGVPCDICHPMLRNSGIKTLVTRNSEGEIIKKDL